MAITKSIPKSQMKIKTSTSRTSSSGANLAKRLMKEELALEFEDIFNRSLSDVESFHFVDIEHVCGKLGILPASLHNTLHGFAVTINARNKVKIEWLAGKAANAFFDKVETHMGTEPEERKMGGLSFSRKSEYELPEDTVTIGDKKKVIPQKVKQFYLLAVTTYWRVGSNSGGTA